MQNSARVSSMVHFVDDETNSQENLGARNWKNPKFQWAILRETEWETLKKQRFQEKTKDGTLRIQVCPKKGISPTILFWRWDFDHQSYSRDGSGSLGG